VRYTGVGMGASVPVCPAIVQKNLMMVRRKNNALLRFAEKIFSKRKDKDRENHIPHRGNS
jgi:hypothetical protein